MTTLAQRRSSALSAALLLAVSVAVLSLLVVEIYDLDVWWHVAIGRWILDNGAIPVRDVWTVLGAGRPYHDSHWLFQVLAGAADRHLGLIGVQSIQVGLWALAFAALWRLARCHVGRDAAALLLLVVAVASSERFLPRPELATFAALAWFMVELQQDRPWTPVRLARLAFVQLLWTNAHGLFVLGPAAVACYVAAAALRPRPRRHLRGLLAALAVTGLASLVSPWGTGAWAHALLLWREASGSHGQVVSALGEMTSPFAAAARDSPAMWCYYLLVAAFLFALPVLRPRRWLRGDVLLALLALGLSLSGRRNVVLFALASVPPLAGALALIRWPAFMRGSVARAAATAAAAGVAAAALSGSYFLHLEVPARTGLGATPSFFPHGFSAFVRERGFSGRVLNSNTVGGFVTYHLGPEVLPLTDGRWEVQDQARLDRTLAASRSPGTWRALIAEYDLNGVLLAHTSPEAKAMLPELARAADWKLVYFDAAASFWRPRAPQDPTPGLDPLDPRILPPLNRSEDAMLVVAYAANVGGDNLELAALVRGLAFGWRKDWFLERIGLTQVRLALWTEAEQTFRELLRRDGKHRVALNELAFLAFQRGDHVTALALLDRLVAVEPGNQAYIQNRDRVVRAVQAARR